MVESGRGEAAIGDRVEEEYQFYHDVESGGSLSTSIVSAILEIEDAEVSDLGFALEDYVDTDALDSLFAPKLDGTSREGTRIEFTVSRYDITVDSEGHITITDHESRPTASGTTGMPRERRESLQD